MRIRSLVWAFIGRLCQLARFRMLLLRNLEKWNYRKLPAGNLAGQTMCFLGAEKAWEIYMFWCHYIEWTLIKLYLRYVFLSVFYVIPSPMVWRMRHAHRKVYLQPLAWVVIHGEWNFLVIANQPWKCGKNRFCLSTLSHKAEAIVGFNLKSADTGL